MNASRQTLLVTITLLATLAMAACGKPAEVVTVAPPVGAAALANVSDIDVTEHVKTALLNTASLKGAEIAVVTLNGDVRLTGVLDTQGQIDEALRIARAAEGAHTLHDELTLKK